MEAVRGWVWILSGIAHFQKSQMPGGLPGGDVEALISPIHNLRFFCFSLIQCIFKFVAI